MTLTEMLFAASNRISLSLKFAKRIFTDSIVREEGINSMAGSGFFSLQLREDAVGHRYLTIVVKGGDSTIWVGLEKASVDHLRKLLSEYLEDERDE